MSEAALRSPLEGPVSAAPAEGSAYESMSEAALESMSEELA